MPDGKTILQRGVKRAVRRGARESLDRIVRRGSEQYDRERHLPRVVPTEPGETTDTSIDGRKRTLARLARALRAERARGRAGHWTYDLNRHIALAQAYESERRLLRRDPPR